jgi:hypothetical protein
MRKETEPADPLVEVACDESGAEGEKLIGGNTDVFAHASVRLTSGSAAGCVQELRDRIRSPALEYKANHLLRSKHRSALVWLLGRSGPLYSHASVQLTQKDFFAVGRIIDLLVSGSADTGAGSWGQNPSGQAMAIDLYRSGLAVFGPGQWTAFLECFNDLVRAKHGPAAETSAASFFRLMDVMRDGHGQGRDPRAAEIMELLWPARTQDEALLRAQRAQYPWVIPALDPLIPAIIQAVMHWSGGGRTVRVIHDQQTALTPERIALITRICNGPLPAAAPESGRLVGLRLTGLRLVDSAADPRVQVADFLAGVARKIASDELNRRGDAELTALLRPYVDPCSVWGDARSWSRLEPAQAHRVAWPAGPP